MCAQKQEAVKNADLVMEMIVEDVNIKRAVFTEVLKFRWKSNRVCLS